LPAEHAGTTSPVGAVHEDEPSFLRPPPVTQAKTRTAPITATNANAADRSSVDCIAPHSAEPKKADAATSLRELEPGPAIQHDIAPQTSDNALAIPGQARGSRGTSSMTGVTRSSATSDRSRSVGSIASAGAVPSIVPRPAATSVVQRGLTGRLNGPPASNQSGPLRRSSTVSATRGSLRQAGAAMGGMSQVGAQRRRI